MCLIPQQSAITSCVGGLSGSWWRAITQCRPKRLAMSTTPISGSASGEARLAMCGIAGIADTTGRPVGRALLRAMTSVLAHRGPDGEDFVCRGGVGLGHRRLAIIDLATGDQPMATEDGAVQIVFNGEIYNFRELRRELEACGARFRTTSDTEVILRAYEMDGPDCVRKLRGMFAFAILDERSR